MIGTCVETWILLAPSSEYSPVEAQIQPHDGQ